MGKHGILSVTNRALDKNVVSTKKKIGIQPVFIHAFVQVWWGALYHLYPIVEGVSWLESS